MLAKRWRHYIGCSALVLLVSCNFSLAQRTTLAPSPKEDAFKPTPKGFERIFDGETLKGWHLHDKGGGRGYIVRDGLLVCPSDGGGNLYHEKIYKDFVFRFEYRLESGGNNGIGIHAPAEGDAAYVGMECQVLDDYAPMYAKLLPGQYHSSLYRIVPAKRGAPKQAGEWNQEEISAIGRHIKVTVNGKVTVDVDLNTVTDPAILAEHPGMLRDRGYVGFLGHGPAEVQFRNIFIKDLTKPDPTNKAPKGFKTLFNGKDLNGWRGLVQNPEARLKMTPEQLAEATVKATTEALKHWQVVDGVIRYDGKNDNLCSPKDYKDFEFLVEWKIGTKGDSGIYLRGSPQVQIWDNPLGSGGLYNNQKNPSNPTHFADKPIGEWNRFRILMVGDKVTVYLNDELVVHNVTMENYWNRNKPIYPEGAIELQHHGDPLYFRNIYVREIEAKPSGGKH